MHQDTSPTRCYCIIPDASRHSILAYKAGDQYECPSVWLPWRRLKFFPDHIPHIRHELRRATALDLTILRHLQDSEDVQICLMEVQSAADSLPEGCVWLDSRKDIPWKDEQSFGAWRTWKRISQSGDDLSTAMPWERSGWFAEAALWVQARLHEAGYTLKSSVSQWKGAWSWSSLLTAETDKGTVYFKADYTSPPKEVAVVLKLAERWPQNVPHVLAADVERNWMLMSDFAGNSLDSLHRNHYPGALSLFAKIQQSTAPDIRAWRQLGCPDRTPKNILQIAGHLIADTAILCRGKDGLRPEEITELARRMPQIKQRLTQLAFSALPNTISHEDFRAGNIAIRNGEYIFYDWSSTVITHPMFGINYFLNRMHRSKTEDKFRWRNDLQDETRREMLFAFLSQWAGYAPQDQLVSEFWLCRRLHPLYEAVKCYCDLPFIGTTSPWGASALAYIPHAFRELIAAQDYRPVTDLSRRA